MNVYRFTDRMDIETFVVARTMQSALMLYHDHNGASPVECIQINRGLANHGLVIVQQETNEPIKDEPQAPSEIQFHVFSSVKGDYDAVVNENATSTGEQITETAKQTNNPFYMT